MAWFFFGGGFVLFKVGGGIESAIRRRLFLQVGRDKKTLISCLSSDIYLFGFGFFFFF